MEEAMTDVLIDHQSVAEYIAQVYRDERTDVFASQDIVCVGAGISRVVYRKGAWVYKIESGGMWAPKNNNNNETEYRMYQKLVTDQSVPPGYAIPETFLISTPYGPVIVMEYILGDRPDDHGWDERETIARVTGLGDVHRSNIKVRDGVKYIIDMGWDYALDPC